jgi:pimeloyl-ACP methyl ester carboxylesterase
MTMDLDEGGTFTRMRERALAAGMSVARFDFRAHGRSGGTVERLRLAGMRADADAVLDLVEDEYGPDIPVIPVGLSFGGAAAVHAASRPTAAGLVLWYPVVDYHWNYGRGSVVPFTRTMRAAAGSDDPEWSEMPVIAGYHLSRELIEEIRDDTTAQSLASLGRPVLAYHGSRDSIVDRAPLRRIAERHEHVELRLVPGAGHGFFIWRPWLIRRTVAWAARTARAARR